MLTYLLIALAAMLSSTMDVLRNTWSTSIFNHLNREWWDASVSWMEKYINRDKTQGRTYWNILNIKVIIPAMITDAWHILKMLFIGVISASCVFYVPVLGIYDIFVIPVIWMMFFELFSYILKSP